MFTISPFMMLAPNWREHKAIFPRYHITYHITLKFPILSESVQREKGKKMEIRVRCNCGEGSCEEWGIVELQGVVEPQSGFHDSLPNLHIGTLCRPSSQVPLSHPSFFFSSYSLFNSIIIFDSASHCKSHFHHQFIRQMSLILHLKSPSPPAYIIDCPQITF